jgi:hypothetical protein
LLRARRSVSTAHPPSICSASLPLLGQAQASPPLE